jgi:NAD(P)-dependent dehydrogenase (short-subunit alcohol dehydrogenase family)
MSNYQVFITGANRGIGLEFTKQYAAAGWRVIACYRTPQTAVELLMLSTKHSNIRAIALDVANFAQIDAVANELADEDIDVLINNAGIYPSGNATELAWANAFKTNAMAPFKVAQAFTQHLANSQLKKLATLSSKMGSMDDNTSGGSYIYRSSKAAVNMVMKSLSVDLSAHGISVVTLHPGWVQTDMGGPNGLINTQTSVAGMRQVIDHLSLENTGQFIAFDGQPIKW